MESTPTRSISSEFLEILATIFKPEQIITREDDKYENYTHDETEDLRFYPEVAILPENTEQVSALMKACYETEIPITPRGAGTGLSGGALPVTGGVVLSLEKMNKILDIDEANFQVTTEPGVITQVLQEAVKEKGLFYPPDPASKGSCFIGGNIAENSGGPKAVKYGVVKDYVLNLEMVLPNGEVIWTGANVLKNSTGYNLTQLVVGSEGTLGVVTKIVLRLITHPTSDLLMLVPFRSATEACSAVAKIFHSGVTPSGLEFMERDAIEWTVDFLEDVEMDIPEDIQAHLLIEVDGFDQDQLFKECETIYGVLEQFDCGEVLFADSQAKKDELWRLRRSVSEAVKSNSIYKEEDTVVPRAQLPDLLQVVKETGQQYGFRSVCYGHAGDGNLHVNIIKGEMSDEDWDHKLSDGIRVLFQQVIDLGGTISGEHGIGYVQKPYMDIPFNKVQLDLMRNIKSVFDPKGLMNPDKIF